MEHHRLGGEVLEESRRHAHARHMARVRSAHSHDVVTRILIADYDERWPERYRVEAERIRAALGPRALRIEHTGSTSVPGLPAKPIIDILLVVADSAAEAAYAPGLEAAGYVLAIREPDWHEHRMFKSADPAVNLHVFSLGCPEIDRILLFRDWLRGNVSDRE